MSMSQNPEDAHKFFSRKLGFTTGPVEVFDMLKNHEPVNIVDVRAAKDYAKGHVPGAVSLPKEEWSLTNVLDKNRVNVLYCYTPVCHLAAMAAVDFSSRGYRVMEMEGGFREWEAHKLPVETKSAESQEAEPQREPQRASVSMIKDTPRTLH